MYTEIVRESKKISYISPQSSKSSFHKIQIFKFAYSRLIQGAVMINVGEIPLFLLGAMMLCRSTKGEFVLFVDSMSCNVRET